MIEISLQICGHLGLNRTIVEFDLTHQFFDLLFYIFSCISHTLLEVNVKYDVYSHVILKFKRVNVPLYLYTSFILSSIALKKAQLKSIHIAKATIHSHFIP